MAAHPPLGARELDVMAVLWEHGSGTVAERACHPVEEVATQHSDGAPGETRLEQVGAQLVQNFSGRNESRDSRSSIHIAPVRSIPLRTKSKSRLRNGRTLIPQRGRTASPYF